MASTRWDDDDEEDNLGMVFVNLNDTTIMETATTVNLFQNNNTQDYGSGASGESGSIYPAGNESGYSDISGENDCYGCNASMLDSLNVSNSLFPMRTDDSGQYQSDEHHDGLYDIPMSMTIFLCCLYGAISVSALVGNALVLWVVAVSRRMRTVTNMFIANLALADIIIGLFAIPFQFQAALLQRWNLPDFMCAFCPFVQILSVNVSVFTLSAIAVDRYRAVLYPLSARVSKRKATYAILSIWAVGLILALPTEFDYKVTLIDHKGGTKPFCANVGLPAWLGVFYYQGIVVIQYFFPLVIITGAYAHMGFKLWGATAPGNKEESRDAVVLRNKKKVIKMLALVVLMFALCWLPLQTYNFFQTIFPQINAYQYINILWFGFHSLAMSNSCCNPFIYAIYNDKFQREFQARLRCLRRCTKHRDDGNYSEGSDIDRSKIRASYRFTNNRCNGGGSTVTTRSFYNNTGTRPHSADSRRMSPPRGNLIQQNNRYHNIRGNVDRPDSKRFLGVGTCSYHSHEELRNNRHHRKHRHHRHRSTGASSSGGSSSASASGASSNGNYNNNDNVIEMECSSRYFNGDLREGTINYHGISPTSTNFETEMLQQETSLTVMNATATPVAVVTAKTGGNNGTSANGSNYDVKTRTVMAKDVTIKL